MGLLVCLAMLLFQLSNRNAFDSLKKQRQLGQGRSHHFSKSSYWTVHSWFILLLYLMVPLYVQTCSTSSGIFFLTYMYTWKFLRVRSSLTNTPIPFRFLRLYIISSFFIRDTSFTMISLFRPFLFGILCAISMSARVRSATPFPFSMEITFIRRLHRPLGGICICYAGYLYMIFSAVLL